MKMDTQRPQKIACDLAGWPFDIVSVICRRELGQTSDDNGPWREVAGAGATLKSLKRHLSAHGLPHGPLWRHSARLWSYGASTQYWFPPEPVPGYKESPIAEPATLAAVRNRFRS